MNIGQVDAGIAKASRLMNEEYMKLLDDVSAMNAGGKGAGRRSRGGNDLAYLDQQVFGYGGGSQSNSRFSQQQVPAQEQMQFSNSALRESFAQQPPMSGDNFPGAGMYGATPSGYQPGASLLNEQRIQQQSFVQQPQAVYQPQYGQPVGGIDYNTIKHLVSEAIKENLAELKQSLLNESALRGISMPGGNKIQFLDKSGNVYEGQLVLKKKK